MHHILPLERTDSHPPGYYNTQGAGRRCKTESHQATSPGDFPAQPGGYPNWMGRGAESAHRGREHSFPRAVARNLETVSAFRGSGVRRAAARVTRSAALAMIRSYQLLLSPALPPACRFYPTCSAYAYEAVEKWGPLRGAWMALRRLLRCHPWGAYGYDPVPQKSER